MHGWECNGTREMGIFIPYHVIITSQLNDHKGWTIRFLREVGQIPKKNSSRTLTKEKNILHKKTTGKKSCKSAMVLELVRDILYGFHTKIVGFYIKSEMN